MRTPRGGGGRGSGRESANEEIVQGIKDGRIRVTPEVRAAVLEQPAAKPHVPRIDPAPKPEADVVEAARRAAVLEEQARSFADPKPRPGAAGMGIVCRTQTRTLPGEMNKIEAGYAQILEGRKRAGIITDYLYEEHRLKVGVGSWYTPDFFVTFPDGRAHLVEVKPFRYEKDGKVKMIANEDAVGKVRACLLRHPFPILFALGRSDGRGYEWREEWVNGIAL